MILIFNFLQRLSNGVGEKKISDVEFHYFDHLPRCVRSDVRCGLRLLGHVEVHRTILTSSYAALRPSLVLEVSGH